MPTKIAYGTRPQEPATRETTPCRKKQVQLEKPPLTSISESNREQQLQERIREQERLAMLIEQERAETNREQELRRMNRELERLIMLIEQERAEMLRHQERDEPGIARSIIGTDDRLRITPSSPLPWKSICRLRLHFSGFEPKIGTGFLILGDIMLTAGHNLYENDQFAQSIEIYAGINGDFNSNFGRDTVDSSRLRVHEKYKAGDIEYDYGIIILNKPLGAGSAGVVRMQVFSRLTGLTGVVSGYPADIPNDAGSNVPNDGSTQWYCSGALRQTPRQLFYDSDTTSGESGGPVLVFTKVAVDRNEWCAVGIHAYGVDDRAPSSNSGTLITNEMMAQIRQWLPALAPTV